MQTHKINIGLIGLGTVGVGVAAALIQERSRLRARKGVDLVLAGIADVSSKNLAQVPAPRPRFVRNAAALIADPHIAIIAELIGGIEPARTFIMQALRNGKHVVTANKKLLAMHGDELFGLAARHGVELRFEASVCGGIPLISSLQNGLAANRFESLCGIVNGTTNYILTRMDEHHEDFTTALADAQRKGFAEANYKLDTQGEDAAQKIAILARIAFGCSFSLERIYREGIERITPLDIQNAREFGHKIKLLGIIKRRPQGLEVRVHPAMVPLGSNLAGVQDEFNAVLVQGDRTGRLFFSGKGAGRFPTASAVVGDMVELARKVLYHVPSEVAENCVARNACRLVPMDDVVTQYYFRFGVTDQPGVLARVARILAANRISIAAVTQKGRASRGPVPIVMLSHQAQERTVRRAVKAIDALPFVRQKTQLIRVEDIR